MSDSRYSFHPGPVPRGPRKPHQCCTRPALWLKHCPCKHYLLDKSWALRYRCFQSKHYLLDKSWALHCLRYYAGAGLAPAANGSGHTAPRMVIYSPDTYGLGHVRRCIKIVEALKAINPELSVLLLTGSPHAGRFPLPEGVDFVKLPEVVKSESTDGPGWRA